MVWRANVNARVEDWANDRVKEICDTGREMIWFSGRRALCHAGPVAPLVTQSAHRWGLAIANGQRRTLKAG